MAATERITMTMRELDRFKVIQDVADGKLKPWRAAERLELTTRQVRRLVDVHVAVEHAAAVAAELGSRAAAGAGVERPAARDVHVRRGNPLSGRRGRRPAARRRRARGDVAAALVGDVEICRARGGHDSSPTPFSDASRRIIQLHTNLSEELLAPP